MNHSLRTETPDSTASQSGMAWLAMASIYLVMAGHGYVTGALEPLQTSIMKALPINSEQWGWLSSAHYLPSLIMAVAGGILVDRLRPRKALLLFASLAAAGALLLAAADTYRTLVFARLVFGLGADSVLIAAFVGIALRYKGARAGLATGLAVGANRLGAFFAVTSPEWTHRGDWHYLLYLAAALGGSSLVLGACLHFVIARRVARNPATGASPQIRQFHWANLRTLGGSYWYLCGVAASFYAVFYPFRTFAITYFEKTRRIPTEEAALLSGSMLLVAIVATPIVAGIAQTRSSRANTLVLGSILAVLAIPLLNIPQFALWVPTLLLGLAIACVAAVLFTLVPTVVPEQQAGIAMGVLFLLQILAISVTNGAAGALSKVAANEYSAMLTMFLILGLISVGCSLAFAVRVRSFTAWADGSARGEAMADAGGGAV